MMMDQHLTIEDVERFADGEESPSHEHLNECVPCANAVLDAVRMKRAIRDAMRSEPAPFDLQQRITARGPRSATRWLAAAAAVVLIALGSAILIRQKSQPMLPELVDMHVTMLASANPVDVISTDRHTVKPWFEGRVPFAVPVPDLSSTPFRLIGGRVVYWQGNPAAYLLIGKGAHRISVFVFRGMLQSSETSVPGHNILSWHSGGVTLVAIADIPAADLEQLRDYFLNIDASRGVH